MGLFSFRVKKHFMSYYRSTSNVLLTEKKENRQIALVHKAAENFEVGCKYYVKDIIAYYVSFFFFLLETNLEILFQKHFNPFNKKQGKGTKRKYSSMCRVSVMPYNRDISSLTLSKLPFIFWNGGWLKIQVLHFFKKKKKSKPPALPLTHLLFSSVVVKNSTK